MMVSDKFIKKKPAEKPVFFVHCKTWIYFLLLAALSSVPVFLKTRTFLPSAKVLILMRPGFLLLGSTSMRFETSMEFSFSMMPPPGFFWVGFECFLIKATFST